MVKFGNAIESLKVKVPVLFYIRTYLQILNILRVCHFFKTLGDHSRQSTYLPALSILIGREKYIVSVIVV